jgi:hypothetical protein
MLDPREGSGASLGQLLVPNKDDTGSRIRRFRSCKTPYQTGILAGEGVNQETTKKNRHESIAVVAKQVLSMSCGNAATGKHLKQ